MTKKLFYLLSLISVLFMTSCIEDRTNFIYGNVVDKATEAPLEGCQVVLRAAQGGFQSVQQTGADGSWGFEVGLGSYTLTFMKAGYEGIEESDIAIEYEHTLVKATVYLSATDSGTDSEIQIEWDESGEEESDAASGFAGGNGSKGSPYLIKNSKQLRLIDGYSNNDVYFKLVSDIDLNNKNWRPIDFYGTLDGNGHTISNLRVEYNDDECQYRGLIGKLNGGSISNLTIRGVKIYGDYSGTFVGYMYGGQITNCHVILENDSELKSGNYIGGIAGECDSYNASYIINCSVKSAVQDDKYRINGKNYVGGIAGGYNAYLTIESCQVVCNVIGEQYVGGIVGKLSYTCENTKNCLYQGNISGSNRVGGICGECGDIHTTRIAIVGCKVVADIECDGDYVGGIAGSGNVIACYAEGTITCENYSAEEVSGITSRSATLSYSAMECTHSAYRPTGYNNTYSYSIYDDIDNIAEKMQESYSEYCDYWNFNNCWTWIGTIKGKSKQVICPRLAWEQ